MPLDLLARQIIRLGDIGEPIRHVEIEPMPTTEPIREPAPAEPAAVPVPERESVPA